MYNLIELLAILEIYSYNIVSWGQNSAPCRVVIKFTLYPQGIDFGGGNKSGFNGLVFE